MRRNLKLLSAALLFPMAVSAQTDKIQGTIVSETDGQPLIGVVVRVKGTASGTVTDIDGVKLDFPDKWVHLRKSNTEPIIRVYSEAATMADADALGKKLMDVVYSMQ